MWEPTYLEPGDNRTQKKLQIHGVTQLTAVLKVQKHRGLSQSVRCQVPEGREKVREPHIVDNRTSAEIR